MGAGDLVAEQVIRRSVRLSPRTVTPASVRGVQVLARTRPAEPLTEWQGDLLLQQFRRQHGNTPKSGALLSASQVYQELVFAGRGQDAEAIRRSHSTTPASIPEASKSLRFFHSTRNEPALLKTIEQTHANFAALAAKASPNQLESLLLATRDVRNAEQVPAKYLGIDLLVAVEALRKHRRLPHRHSATMSQRGDDHQTSPPVQRSVQRKSYPVPYSPSLMRGSLALEILEMIGPERNLSKRVAILDHLSMERPLLAKDSEEWLVERKLRGVLAAFASWWIGNERGAYEKLSELSEEFSEDDNLKLELARLLVELDSPAQAIERIDAIEVLDAESRSSAELLALKAAAKCKDFERARLAARRLFELKLDETSDLLLVDQLIEFELPDLARAILHRLRHRQGLAKMNLLNVAQRYVNLGDRGEAASAAMAALRRSRSSQATSARQIQYHDRLAVGILQKTGKLDAMLSQFEQQVAASANSQRLSRQLLELYLTLDRTSDADRLLTAMGVPGALSNREILAMADRLVQVNLSDHALHWYLSVFKRDPKALAVNWDSFRSAVKTRDQVKRIYTDI